MKPMLRLATIAIAVPPCALSAACGSESSQDPASTATADSTAPSVQLELTQYAAVPKSATLPVSWSDDIGVVRVDLVVDGEIASPVDVASGAVVTEDLEPGLHEVALEAADEAGNVARSGAISAILEGRGRFLAATDWPAGSLPGWGSSEVAVPPDGTAPEHLKVHTELPVGLTSIATLFHWQADTSWKLGLDVGTGDCPDSGTQLETVEVSGPTAVASITHDDGGTELSPGIWFGHVRVIDPESHAAASLVVQALFLAEP